MTSDDQRRVAAIERDVVVVDGPEAATFLHGQLSQDVLALDVGDAAPTLLLEPQGKVVALARLSRADEHRYLLDTDRGWGEAMLGRLERFKLRTDCTLELHHWPGVAWRGPGAAAVDGGDAPIVASAGWPGVESLDVVGPDVQLEPTMTADEYETARIVARWPAMGREVDESTIPAATGIVDAAVSFTKGCYTGQELVARIDSRGSRTPTRLVGVTADDIDARLVAGGVLTADGDEIGTVTSASTTAPVALAYVKRAVTLPSSAQATTAAGETVAVSLLD